MRSLHSWLSIFVLGSLFAAGCDGSSSGNGAGGALGRGGSFGVGGSVGAGGILGLGGTQAGGGAGGQVVLPDAGSDVAAQLDTRDAASSVADIAPDQPIVTGIDAGVTLAQVKVLLASHCAGCHSGTGSAATRLDLTDRPDAATTLYTRLLGPVPLETFCGESVDAGGDPAQARRAIVPGDPGASFLYLKITGTQPSPGNPPANCGVRMPRLLVPGVDGGAATFPSCDSLDGGAAANCLSAADIDLVRQWIVAGAPE